MRWAICWKCGIETKSRETTPYLNCRQGKFSFCDPCFDEFLKIADPWIQQERINKDSKICTAIKALDEFHMKNCKRAKRIIVWDCDHCGPVTLMLSDLRIKT